MVFAIDSEIRECHVYKDVWNAGIDFELSHPPKSAITKTGMPLHTHPLLH